MSPGGPRLSSFRAFSVSYIGDGVPTWDGPTTPKSTIQAQNFETLTRSQLGAHANREPLSSAFIIWLAEDSSAADVPAADFAFVDASDLIVALQTTTGCGSGNSNDLDQGCDSPMLTMCAQRAHIHDRSWVEARHTFTTCSNRTFHESFWPAGRGFQQQKAHAPISKLHP